MPRIEHVALWTQDITRLRDFYVKYFGARPGPPYGNPAHAQPGAQRHGLTHLAVSVGSEQRVDALTREIGAAGHPVLDGPRRTGDGYYESVVLDPDGNRIEITV